MFSSFPATEFPTLRLSQETASTAAIYKDTSAVRPVEEPSDETLIARICADDSEALAILFRRYARLVWCIAQRILRDGGEAEDVMQEVFLMVHQKTSIFDASKGPARTLIVYLTYRLAYKRRRYLNGRHAHYSTRLNESGADLTAATMPFYDQSIEAHFGREGLRNALGELSDAQRETLRLFFFEGCTLDEIAMKLGESLGNVRHHYFRGLDRLRKHLKAMDSGK